MRKKLDQWIADWYASHPGEKMDCEVADAVFVKLCVLLQEVYEKKEGDSTYSPGHLSADSFELEEDEPVSFAQGTREADYCPYDEEETQATDLFGMGLILFELLTGHSYAETFQVQVGMDFSELEEEWKEKGKDSLLDADAVPGEYQELGTLLAELTCFCQEERLQNFKDEEIPVSSFDWIIVDADTGQDMERRSGLISSINQSENPPSSLKIGEYQYQVVPGQKLKAEYSFLKKEYRVLYRAEVSEQSVKRAASLCWREYDWGIAARRRDGTCVFLQILPGSEKENVAGSLKMGLPEGLPMNGGLPYVSIDIVARKKGNSSINRMNDYPDLFQTVKEFVMEDFPVDRKWESLEVTLIPQGELEIEVEAKLIDAEEEEWMHPPVRGLCIRERTGAGSE